MKITYPARQYQHPTDQAAVLDIVRARPASRVHDYPGLSDLYELLGRSEIQANSQVWLAPDGSLAGFAFNDHYPDFSGLSFEYHAEHKNIASEMLDWCLANFEANRQEQANVLQLSVDPENTGRITLLEEKGFACEDWSLVKMTRPLAEPVPAPRLPEGFSIWSFKGVEEIDAMVALHRAAFGTNNLTTEDRISWMQVPGYDHALDLVAVAPDGSLAAYAFFAVHSDENARTDLQAGNLDSVGTHPAYQRMGLSRALLLAGLRILKERGIATASLTTASYNMAMQRAAGSAGFEPAGRILYYSKASSIKAAQS